MIQKNYLQLNLTETKFKAEKDLNQTGEVEEDIGGLYALTSVVLCAVGNETIEI